MDMGTGGGFAEALTALCSSLSCCCLLWPLLAAASAGTWIPAFPCAHHLQAAPRAVVTLPRTACQVESWNSFTSLTASGLSRTHAILLLSEWALALLLSPSSLPLTVPSRGLGAVP